MDGGVNAARSLAGGERSFKQEVHKLLLGDGEEFHGEGIMAITKALLQSGVSYVGGYPGAPISYLIDVLSDASEEILQPMGIRFEQSSSEAGAGALLGASINYPLRGAVTWKSVVGTNVASDALSNIASVGVIGGAVIVMGEDYGEGASIIQERTHSFAMKSSIPLIDPRYDMSRVVDLTEQAFELSEASNLPVFISLRIRACHMTGSFKTKNNREPKYSLNNPVPESEFDFNRIAMAPVVFEHEKQKVNERFPAARRYIVENDMNELFSGAGGRYGIVTQGGTYTVVMRGLKRLGLADAYGNSDIPVLCLNVIHPLVPEQIENFLKDKDSIVVVEEGNPNYIESQIAELAHKKGIACRVHGKDVLPMAGEYVADVVRDGLAKYLKEETPVEMGGAAMEKNQAIEALGEGASQHLPAPMPPRPPSFCTGCPERPVMAAIKLLMKERGKFHVSMDIGCNTFGTLPPFSFGSTVVGYGLGLASGSAIAGNLDQPTVAIMGDGGFWHSGFSTGVINARWNNYDTVLIILDNGYASATGQHHTPSTGTTPIGRSSLVPIESALKGIGVQWIKYVDSYSLEETKNAIAEAFDAKNKGLRVIISNNECMLAKQRAEKPAKAIALKQGQTVTQEKFGVDEEVCTGDHSCMRLSGCPSLTLKQSSDPLKETPVAFVSETCVACGHCGEVAHTAQLCPSFYRAEAIQNAGPLRKFASAVNRSLLSMMGAS